MDNSNTPHAYQHLLKILNKEAIPLFDEKHKFSKLIEEIGDARFVLLGEATHGTEEFYLARIEITKRLIEEKGFMAVAIEGDWPDVYSVHRYLQGVGDIHAESESLSQFTRFPTWMWRNTTIPPFLRWLREFNDNLPAVKKIGFYGLDLYSLYTSIDAVIYYLSKIDPQAALQAKQRYACFDHIRGEPQEYGMLISMGLKKSCVKEVIEQIVDLSNNVFKYLGNDGFDAQEEYFYAAQNARLIKNAEKYYRSMFEGHVTSWNNRDTHMFETITQIASHLESRFNKAAKLIIWAHNSHLGDARATEMGAQGEINVGQLIRERYPRESYGVGFSTYQGTVMAASSWGTPGECKPLLPGLSGSYEELFHDMTHDNFHLILRGNEQLSHYLHLERLQRAVGVVYLPQTQRLSHYYYTNLPKQFDSIIHFDNTHGVKPL